MSGVAVSGVGAVSPAGWGVAPFREVLAKGVPVAPVEIARPGWAGMLRVRRVPPPAARPAFLVHPRLRRTSPVTHFAVAAALEALGTDTGPVERGELRLGIVFAVFAGCVNYTRRFYTETWQDPASASPLVFPETVFNAPASHLTAMLGSPGINYTLVGDAGVFMQGLAIAAGWLSEGRVDGCLVVGAEESDWLVADASRHFYRRVVVSEGAGALYLKTALPGDPSPRLDAITDAHLFPPEHGRHEAIARMRAQLPPGGEAELLCDSLQNAPRLDAAEEAAWRGWPGARVSPKTLLGEGLMAAAAWQCVAAVDAIAQGQRPAATVSVASAGQEAIGARFVSGNGGG